MSLSDPSLQGANLSAPAALPPPGTVAHVGHPAETQTAQAVIGFTVILVVILVSMSIRTYTRIAIIGGSAWKSWEDCFAMLATLLFIVFYGLTINWTINFKQGWHQYDLTVQEMGRILYAVMMEQIFYGLCYACVKISILFQYIQIFSTKGKRDYIWWTCRVLIIVISLFYLATIFINLFECSPREKIWMPWIETGSCIDFNYVNWFSASFNLATDLIMLLLPQNIIWRLHMSTQKKVGVSLLFLIAAFAVGSSAMRLYYVSVLIDRSDKTWTYIQIGTWAFMEVIAAFICSCVPSITKFVRSLASQRHLSSTLRRLDSRDSPAVAWPGSPSSRKPSFTAAATMGTSTTTITAAAGTVHDQDVAPDDSCYGLDTIDEERGFAKSDALEFEAGPRAL